MDYRYEDQQQRQQLLTIVDRGTVEQLFTFLQGFHRRPFQNMSDVLVYDGVIDDQIDFIDCTGTKYNVTPLIIAAGKGSYEKTKILLVHGANPNQQCATGDSALNLAVHRQKYPIVDLLIQYHANPNVYNQAGKTALHRAVVSYNDENANQIRALLNAGADPNIEDRNQRIPLDEAVIANRPKIVDVLLSHDQTLIQHSYRAAIIASRLGHDKCLETLLNYGMDPNISDRTNTTPLHVAVRSLKLSTVQLLIANGANQNLANNRGETAANIAECLQPDQQQIFLNALLHTPQIALSDSHSYKSENAISNIYPLLRNHSNWTLDSDEFRSRTDQNSSVQNLLDISSETYWRCIQSKNAWIIFDLKDQYNINGVRIIGCENQSTPKNGHFDVSNALNGPWLKVKDLTCLLTQGNKNDFFFPSLKTRFIRVFILDNYGGDDIRICGISFFGVEMRLINLLKEYGLENSLNTLLANNINDQETLDENRDEILNSSDKYLHVNDHFQFIRLIESLRLPQLTFLEWFNPPQTTILAGEKFQTFSVAADEGVTNRVKLEEKLENNPQATIILMKDLEPVQGRSLVDFPDYIINNPGRYQIRVVSIESPDIHTSWQEIVVGPTLSYPSRLNTVSDEPLYLSPTTHFVNDTTSDKENTLESLKKSTTFFTNKENRAFIVKVYESENEDTEDDTYLISLKSIEDSPYCFSLQKMSHTTDHSLVNYRPEALESPYKPQHFTQTKPIDNYDHSTITDEDYEDESNNPSQFNSKSRREIYLTPTKYRSVSRTPLANIFPDTNIKNQKQSDDYETLDFGDKIIIPTKYRLEQDRMRRLLNDENTDRPQQQSQYQKRQPQNQNEFDQEFAPLRQQQSQHDQRQHSRKRSELDEEPLQHKQQQQSHYHPRQQFQQKNGSGRESSPEQQSHYYELNPTQKRNESVRESPPQQHQSQYQPQQESPKRMESEDLLQQQPSQNHQHGQQQNQNTRVQDALSTPPQQQQSQYHQREQLQQQNNSQRESSPQQQQSDYYEIDQSQKRNEPVRESPPQQQQSRYRQQGQLQNENAEIQDSSSPPHQQQSQYHRREQSQPRNGSQKESSPQQQQSDYYEIDQTQKRNESIRESPPQQQQSQYRQQGQQQNQNTRVQDSSPPPSQHQQQTQYHPRQQPRQQDGSAKESSPERPQSDYYQVEQPQKRNESVGESLFRQQQSRQPTDSATRTSPPQLKQQQRQQQSRKRNESERDSPYLSPHYDEISQPRVELDEELHVQHQHHRQQLPTENIDQDRLKPVYNRYQVISGDFELRESRSDSSSHTNDSKPSQMQLIFKATLQGPDVQKRAKNSIYELVNNRSRTPSTSNINKQNNLNKASYPNSPQSPTTTDRRNQNTTNIGSNHEREYQTGSGHNSRLNSMSQIARSPIGRTKPVIDHLSPTVNYPSFQPSSPPDQSIKRSIYNDNQSHLSNQRVPSNMTTHRTNDNDLDGIHERSRSSSQEYTPSKYNKNPLKQTNNSRSSPLLSSPKATTMPFEHKSKYFFGENVQNHLSDDEEEEDDETECETFGHNSQPRPLLNTHTGRNLDYPSRTNPPFSMNDNNYPENLQFTQQTEVGTFAISGSAGQRRSSSSENQSTVEKTRDSSRDIQSFTTNKQIPPQGDYEIPDTYPISANYNVGNQNISSTTSTRTGFQQQYQDDTSYYEQNIESNIRQEQSNNKFGRDRDDDNQSQSDVDDHDSGNNNSDQYHDDKPDIHDPNHNDRNYMNDVDDEDDTSIKDDESHHSLPRPSGVDELLRHNPVRDTSTNVLPTQYPPIHVTALPEPDTSSTKKKPKKGGLFGFLRKDKTKDIDKINTKSSKQKSSKKPLEITVRTADHSHLYTPGIIPPKLPSTPTTDISDEITKRDPFDKPQTFHHTLGPYLRDSRENTEEDTEDSDPMSEARLHNRNRSVKIQTNSKVRNYGTQSETKSTRNIGTMSEPIKTRNYGNEVQPQSSATQTLGLLRQQQYQTPYNLTQQDETDLKLSTSHRSQHDTRTNGYYPSQRSTSLDRRNKYVLSSSMAPRQKDYSDYDQHQTPYLSQYNDDSRGQYITTRNDYQRSTNPRPHSSLTRQRIPSPTNLHHTPPPPAEYRTTIRTDRYRTPSPSSRYRFGEPQRSRSPSPPTQKHIQPSTIRQRSRSPSPPIQKHIHTSISQQRTVSPPSQRRSRPSQRSPSPPSSRHHISSSTKLHHTPSPPADYHSTSPPPKNSSRKTKDRRLMVSAETDTSLDCMKPQQHQGFQPEPPSTRDYGVTTNAEQKHSPQTNRSTNPDARSSYSQYQTLNTPLPKHQDYIRISPYHDNYQSLRTDQTPSIRKNYQPRPVRNDSYTNDYEEIPVKHDVLTTPEYTPSVDRRKGYTSKPFTGNYHRQASPTFERRPDEEEQQLTVTFHDDVSNEKYIRELPTGGSISIPSTTVIQPDTLPRSYGQNKSPPYQKQDRVDNRRKMTELPLHRGVERTTSINDSPVLNIGTQNIIYQSPNNEFTTPFETRYVRDPDDDDFTSYNNNIRSSTLKRDDLKSRNNRILLLPVLNSSRTYVFEKQLLPANQMRQSRTNGNFYLATSPTLRSLNSSFQIDDSEFDPLTQPIDSTNLSSHGLRSQVA